MSASHRSWAGRTYSFIEIMNEYRYRKRNNSIMQTIAGRFSNDEIAALAAYFGSVKGR